MLLCGVPVWDRMPLPIVVSILKSLIKPFHVCTWKSNKVGSQYLEVKSVSCVGSKATVHRDVSTQKSCRMYSFSLLASLHNGVVSTPAWDRWPVGHHSFFLSFFSYCTASFSEAQRSAVKSTQPRVSLGQWLVKRVDLSTLVSTQKRSRACTCCGGTYGPSIRFGELIQFDYSSV